MGERRRLKDAPLEDEPGEYGGSAEGTFGHHVGPLGGEGAVGNNAGRSNGGARGRRVRRGREGREDIFTQSPSGGVNIGRFAAAEYNFYSTNADWGSARSRFVLLL